LGREVGDSRREDRNTSNNLRAAADRAVTGAHVHSREDIGFGRDSSGHAACEAIFSGRQDERRNQ